MLGAEMAESPLPSASSGPLFELGGARVWVAGHRGMVGSAIVRRLEREDCEILTVERTDVDLIDQAATGSWIKANRPDIVFLAAAKVGGILANDRYPADFLYDNLMIESNVIRASLDAGVRKLVFLGSSCVYPKSAPQPIPESALLKGALEPTNEAYAIAKIAGLKLVAACRRQHGADYISLMPANLYGPNDNFDLDSGHVVPALLRKVHQARRDGSERVVIWGSGLPRREFLHVDDLADACVFLARTWSAEEPINVGTGRDCTISELAQLIGEVVGWTGSFVFDANRPDGTPRKLLDVSRLSRLGWAPRIGLEEGLAQTYAWYLANAGTIRGAPAPAL
jgi:GDP-L-fucose synthase